jgi:hypothetical protein
MGTHGVGRTSHMGCPQRGIESASLGKRPMGHPGCCLVTEVGSASRSEGELEVSARETLIVPAALLIQPDMVVVLLIAVPVSDSNAGDGFAIE